MTTEFLRKKADHFTVTRHAIAIAKERMSRDLDFNLNTILDEVSKDLAN